ncbi:hypothetical protein HGQ17_02425 [Nesterenkonia sp. MY13]|uniref:Uncharacterized protein n=1 Tax=Nesterenkonia sedimenti TaxID=1463632 RepID=A0A7X8YCR7_9MICC|nr:hypothetical protein [Nesterenkonia sedimenti]NLS08874.1 hypothetical protein [Nesterenkonia sedimenti]
MTLGLWLTTAGFVDMIPTLPIHSSVLIVLVAGLFLAALVLRAQRLPQKAADAQKPGLSTRQARAARRRVQQGTTMSTARKTTQANDGFQIYWGRTFLAVVGLLALIAAVGGALLVPFTTAITWAVPLWSGAVFLAALVSLQVTAAVRRRHKRRQRIERAFQEAIETQPEPQRTPEAEAPAPKKAPFDAMTQDRTGVGGPDSLVRTDEDGLADNPERLFGSQAPKVDASLFDQGDSADKGEKWEPREVPQAKYMVAEKAERSTPEVQVETSPAEAEESAEQEAEAKRRKEEVKLKQPAAAPAEPSMDLDAVLSRRRA